MTVGAHDPACEAEDTDGRKGQERRQDETRQRPRQPGQGHAGDRRAPHDVGGHEPDGVEVEIGQREPDSAPEPGLSPDVERLNP